MNICRKNRFLLLLVAAVVFLSGCDKNKPPIVDSKTKTISLSFGDTIRLYTDSGDIIVFDSVFDQRAPYYDCSRFDLLDPHAILGFSLKKNGTPDIAKKMYKVTLKIARK